MIGKPLSPQEMVESSEEAFKFVRIHDTKYGWFWRFCHMDVEHVDMVAENETPLSAGFIFVIDGQVTFPEEINLPNYSTTLGINSSKKDHECIPILFGEHSKATDGKYTTNEFRDTDDSSSNGDEGKH
jgi:hypothetical protein